MEKKKEETKIAKIILKVEGKELSLSLDGAKELRKLLNGLFGEVTKEVHHHHNSYTSWSQPWIAPPKPLDTWYTVTCGDKISMGLQNTSGNMLQMEDWQTALTTLKA